MPIPRQICEGCRWWKRDGFNEPRETTSRSGDCIRFPPSPIVTVWSEQDEYESAPHVKSEVNSIFPSTNEADVCGEWFPL